MLGYCGVSNDKINFGVPVSKKQIMFSLRLIKMQCCVFVWVGELGGGRDRDLVCSPQIARALIPNPVPDRAVSSDSSHHPIANSHQSLTLSQGHNLILQYEKYVISRPI